MHGSRNAIPHPLTNRIIERKFPIREYGARTKSTLAVSQTNPALAKLPPVIAERIEQLDGDGGNGQYTHSGRVGCVIALHRPLRR